MFSLPWQKKKWIRVKTYLGVNIHYTAVFKAFDEKN